jgi:ubiquinone/menaquinone biosynthesis C-methylase UbiE
MNDAPYSFWDEAYRSEDYLQHWEYAHPSQELVAAVACGLAPAGGTALDIGCGTGREAIFLARCKLRVIGVDFSAEGLAIARRNALAAGAQVDWRQGSALALPVDAACVDFANDRGCFHVVARADRPQYAAEVHRILKPGGCLLLRGAGADAAEENFVKVDEAEIDHYFDSRRFAHGPVLPLLMLSDAGVLEGNIVVLKKRA